MLGAASGLFMAPALQGAPVAIVLLAACGAMGAWLVRDGLRRGRLAGGGAGPGLVAVREGSIAYFGPYDGGVADLDALRSIALAPARGGPLWLLRGADGSMLRVPATADGAEALLDAFAALPGFDPARADHALGARVETIVWSRPARAAGALIRLPPRG
jgi:hypothetical protein